MNALVHEDDSAHGEGVAGRARGAGRLGGVGWAAGGVALALLSFQQHAVTRQYTWPDVATWTLLLALPPLGLIVRLVAVGAVPRLGRALDLGLVWCGLIAIGSAAASPWREQSLPAALLPLSAICTAFLFRAWLRRNPTVIQHRAGLALSGLGFLAVGFALTSHCYWFFVDVGPALDRGTSLSSALAIRNIHPLGHSNYTAGFGVLCTPLLAALILTTRGWTRVAWSLGFALVLALVFASGSRGGVLALLFVTAAAAGLVLSHLRLRPRTRVGILLLCVVGAVTAIALNPRLRELAVHRAWSGQASESNQQRIEMLEAGWRMGLDRPLLGSGPGTVPIVYQHHRAQLTGAADGVLQLHNTPVQIWAVTGAGGVIGALLILVGMSNRTWRMLRAPPVLDEDNPRRTRLWALVFALTGYGVFSLTDHQLDVPLFALMSAVLLALLAGESSASVHHVPATWTPTLVRVIPAVAIAGGLVAIAWFAIPDLRARAAFNRGMTALERGDHDGFAAGVARARELAPREPFYLHQRAVALQNQAGQSQDVAQARELLAQAAAQWRESLAVRPGEEVAHFNLGWLLLDLEQPGEAAKHFRAAAQVAPTRGGVYFGLGLALLLENKPDAATRAFALEWINDPRAATSPVWEREGLRERRAGVLAAMREQLSSVSDAHVPAPLHRRAQYVTAVVEWWADPNEAKGAHAFATADNDERRAFFRLVTEGKAPDTAVEPEWAVLHRAWRADAPAGVLESLAPWHARLREPVARRIAAHRESFATFLTAPVGGDTALVRRGRNERTAYGLLAHNSDGMRVVDRYVFEDNLLAGELLPFLFPTKGWLPAPVLVDLLATIPE